jgi:hypothetical protein
MSLSESPSKTKCLPVAISAKLDRPPRRCLCHWRSPSSLTFVRQEANSRRVLGVLFDDMSLDTPWPYKRIILRLGGMHIGPHSHGPRSPVVAGSVNVGDCWEDLMTVASGGSRRHLLDAKIAWSAAECRNTLTIADEMEATCYNNRKCIPVTIMSIVMAALKVLHALRQCG